MLVKYFRDLRTNYCNKRIQEFEKNFRKLTIDDLSWVTRACHEDGTLSNHATFLGMLILQEQYAFDIFHEFHNCVTKCPWKEEDTLMCAFPIGSAKNREAAIRDIVKMYSHVCSKIMFMGASEEGFHQLEKLFPGKIESWSNDLSDQNYILDVQEQIKLEGSAFADRRNKIRRFNKLYPWTWEEITEENIGECRRLQAEWCESYGDDEVTKEDELAMDLILKYYRELEFRGELYRVDGVPVAFAIGCPHNPLNKNCYVHCVSKAKKEYRDVTIATLHDFIKRNCTEYTYSNYSNDQGLPGLRKFKMMLRPKLFTDFYFVTVDLKK